MSETNRSSFWAKHRFAVPVLVFTALVLLIVGSSGCGGGGGGSTTTDGSTTGTLPDVPTGLTAAPGNGSVTLNWNAANGADNYKIFRATLSAGPFTDIQDFVTSTTFTNSSLTNGTTYFYRVVAHNSTGDSGASNTASATPTTGVIGASWLPANTIFYTAADSVDPTITNVNKINPNGTGNTIFATESQQYIAASPNPNVQNQLLFAYTTDPVPGASSVFAIYRNTSVSIIGAVKLTDQTQNGFNNVGSIGFLPNGQKIFFTAQIGSDHGLYLMNPNGTSVTRVASADDASLSPDGTKILFSEPQGGQDDIFYYTVSDGTTHAVLQTANEDEILPQWSKDGSKIVFAGQPTISPTAPFDIFVLTVGSASPTQLTANGDFNLSPSLSPDGSQVAYVRISTSVGTSGVYKAPTAGGAESPVVLSPTIGGSLYWTSASGRAVGGGFGGPSFSMGHTLHRLPARLIR